jgi:hypothetical protein
MRRGLLIAMVGCGSVASPVAPAPAPPKPPPRSAVLVRTERRPSVGARWHEHDTITETEARGSEHHDRTQVLDADVSVVAQAPEREMHIVTRERTPR